MVIFSKIMRQNYFIFFNYPNILVKKYIFICIFQKKAVLLSSILTINNFVA